jgi:transcription initiation factor TFIID subunit 3
MKKHSKTGVESRFAGTALGHPNDPKPVRIEGGPADSINAWNQKLREKAAKAAKSAPAVKPVEDADEQSDHILESMEMDAEGEMDSQ